MVIKMSEKLPNIRFKNFDGNWEEKFLGDEVEFYSGLTYSPENIVTDQGTLVIRSSNVKNGELINADNVYVDPTIVNSEQVRLGDIIVVVRNGSRNLIGKHATVKQNLDNTVIGAFMTGIRSKNFNFINAILDSNRFNIEINKNLGATINQITTGNFKKMKFYFPVNEEQQKIGELFRQLDDTMVLQQKLLEQHQKYKESMLRKLFPQKGESIPKFRFNGFNGKWEIRKFKDFISKAGKKNNSENDFVAYSVSNKLGLVRQDEQFENSRLEDLDKKSYKLVNPNEFAYNPARINVGSIAFNNLGNTVIVSSLYVVLKMSEKINNDYILQFIKSANFLSEVKRNTEGSVREYLFYENFKNVNFPYPSDYEEQRKIGEFLKRLDETIAIQQKKLDEYHKIKKALLNKVFV